MFDPDLDPERYFQELRGRASGDQKEFPGALLQLVREPYNIQRRARFLHKNFAACLVAPSHPSYPVMAGALGFFLFAFFAEEEAANQEAEKPERKDKFHQANRYLNDSNVLRWMMAKGQYDIPDDVTRRTRALKLHKVGTTSFVVRLHPPQEILKLVKPRFWDSQTIQMRTRDYDELFSNFSGYHKDTPKLERKGNDRWLSMQYIDGQTLREFIGGQAYAAKGPKHLLASAKQVADRVSSILKDFADNDIHHLDLSPDNVLVETRRYGEGDKFWLIDFGINFVLMEIVPRTKSAVRAQQYIAPEVVSGTLSNSRDDHELADVYSLSLIVTETLVGSECSTKYEALDRVWQQHPRVGGVLQQALEDDPLLRLAQRHDQHALNYFQACLDAEVEFEDAVLYPTSKYGFVPKLLKQLDAYSIFRTTVLELVRSVNFARKNASRKPGPGSLLIFAVVAQFLHNLNIGVATYALVTQLHPLTPDTVTGMLVALTFSALALKVYIEAFGTVTARGLSAWAEVSMRVNAVWFAVPVLGTIVLDPTAWPVFTVLGIAPLVTTLLVCRQGFSRVERRIQNGHRPPSWQITNERPPAGQGILSKRLANWAANMSGVGLILLMVAVMSLLGTLGTVWPWGVTMAMTNILMYRAIETDTVRLGILKLVSRAQNVGLVAQMGRQETRA